MSTTTNAVDKTAYELQLEATLGELLDALDRQYGGVFSLNVNQAREVGRRYVPKRVAYDDMAPVASGDEAW